MAGELRRLAAGRLDVLPADDELRLLAQAVKPNDQSTSLFAAISVMVGFLLALNAMLLTVPERRRFVADLRMQGYDWRQIVVMLGFQAGRPRRRRLGRRSACSAICSHTPSSIAFPRI